MIPPFKPHAEVTTSAPAEGRVPLGAIVAGKYVVERELAVGGVGTVVRARHLELGHKVAIKYLHSRLLGEPAIVERFKREARLVASIRSEHVVRVHDVGALDDGTPYIVMEHLEGEDLGAVVLRGAVPIASAIDWIIQACDALAEAHSLGIVHRDLKPENLFLAQRRGARPIVKLVDFGISKVASGSREALGVRKTLAGERFGTPLYMSPEQLLSSGNVDVRSDIWALGVVLYELLAGELPFGGPDLPSIISSVLTSTPSLLRTKRPDASPALEALVASCLSRRPADRPANVIDLMLALGSIAPDASVHRRSWEGEVAPAPGGETESPRAARQHAETAYNVGPTPPLAWEPSHVPPAGESTASGPTTSRSRVPRSLVGAVLVMAVSVTSFVVGRGARIRSASDLASSGPPPAVITTASLAGATCEAPPLPVTISSPLDGGTSTAGDGTNAERR